MDPTQSSMPMGQAAKLPIDTSDIMGAMPTRSPAMGAPPATAAGLIGTPNPGEPLDSPHEATPFDVQMQADGSSVYMSKTNPPVVLGVNPPPKLPKALNPNGAAK